MSAEGGRARNETKTESSRDGWSVCVSARDREAHRGKIKRKRAREKDREEILCVYVRERAREKDRERDIMCVCVREIARERERGGKCN